MKKLTSLLLALLLVVSTFSAVSANGVVITSFSETEMGNWTAENVSNWSGNFLVTDAGALRITHLNPTSNGTALKPKVNLLYNPGMTLVKGATYTVKYDFNGKNISGGQMLIWNFGSNKVQITLDGTQKAVANEISGPNSSFWADGHKAEFTFTVDDIQNEKGETMGSVKSSRMFFHVQSNGRADAVNYDGVAFDLLNLSITEKLPDGYEEGGDEGAGEITHDPLYNTVTTVINETFDSNVYNWNGVNLTPIRDEAESAMKAEGVTVNSRFRYSKKLTIKRNAVYTVSYKVKASSTVSWLFGIEASEAFLGGGKAMYDNSRRNVGQMSTRWQTVSYSFATDSDMENPSTQSIAVFFMMSSAADWVMIDDFTVVETLYPELPVISGGEVRGATVPGGSLSPDCTVSDKDGVLKQINYTWQLSADNENWEDASNEEVCTLPADSVGKYVRFKAVPESLATNEKCEEFISPAKIIVESRALPSAGDVSVSGEGDVFTVSYTYVKGGDIDEGETAIRWQYSRDGEKWTTLVGENGETFVHSGLGAGCFIRAVVIPTDADGVEGAPAYSDGKDKLPNKIDIFVSPDGSEFGTGRIDAPYATIGQAKMAVRALIEEGVAEENDITVYLREGDYFLSGTETFNASDSGTPEHPVVYKSYPGEEAVLTGGKTVPDSEIVKVTDASVLDRIIDKTARENLLSVDLSKYYSEIPDIPDYTHDNDAAGNGMSIFFTQVRPVVNGKTLDYAQWPNKDEAELPITAVSSTETTMTYTVDGIASRTALWQEPEKVRTTGHHNGTAWTYQTYKVDGISENDITIPFKSNYSPSTDGQLKFYNIPEEIDVPGESYIDIDTKTLYFYPYDGDATPEVVLPVTTSTLVNFYDVSNITFENLGIEAVRSACFNIDSATGNVTLNGCRIAYQNAMSNMRGKNGTIENCTFYDGAVGGLNMSGGDSVTLTPSGNVVKNSVFRECSKLKRAYGHSIMLSGVGQVIEGCDIGYADGDLIALSGQMHRITGNYIHHGTQWTGDMGTIYFGRSPVSIGIEIDNNYFYSHGSEFHDGWAQAIFADDATICPYIHDNVFYQASLPTSEGGSTYPIKTNGGMFMKVSNNVFVDSPWSAQFQCWGNSTEFDGYTKIKFQEMKWLLMVFEKYKTSYGWKTALMNAGVIDADYNVSPVYREKLAGTQWEPYLDILESGFYEKVKDLDPAAEADYTEIIKIASEYAPGGVNIFDNNATFESASTTTALHNWSVCTEETNSYIAAKATGIFEDYGTDFTMTDAGLAKIRTKAKDFEAIDFGAMGLSQYSMDGSTLLPGGNIPSASGAFITEADGYLRLDYSYSGDAEGFSTVNWYLDGNPIPGKHDTMLEITSSMSGKSVYAEVVPMSIYGALGEAVSSAAVRVGSDNSIDAVLEALISEAELVAASVPEGSSFGQVSKSEKDAFTAAIADAKTGDKTESYKALTTAFDAFKASVVTDGNLSGNAAIFPFMGDVEADVPSDAAVVLPANVPLQAMKFTGTAMFDGVSCPVTLEIPAGSVINSDDPSVTVNIFGESQASSVAVSKADTTKLTAFKLGDGATVSKAWTLTVNAQLKSKYASVISDGKAGEITSNTSSAGDVPEGRFAKISDRTVYAIAMGGLGEIVIYSREAASSGDDSSSGGGGGGGGSSAGVSSSGGGGGGTSSSGSTVTYDHSAAGGTADTGTVSGGAEEFCFDDVKTHWAKNDIMSMYAKGIVSGVTETTFEPDRSITRAEFATLIVKALKLEAAEADFADVKADDWFAPFVGAAAKAGIIAGSDGMFRPDDVITREEMAVIIVKSMEYLGKSSDGEAKSFTDSNDISGWAAEYVSKATAAGLISGMEDSRFAPAESATRAQAASLISRLIG